MIRYDFGTPRVCCGFTTRAGGVSPFPIDAMNMSFKREPSRENVLENYRRAAQMLGMPFEGLTGVTQVHGRSVLRVTAELAGSGICKDLPDNLENGYDAMITDVPGVTLCTVHGDCTPIFLYDPEHDAVGAVHSGWRGTVLKIAEATVTAMTASYETDPGKLQVIIGPSISRDAFETDADVYIAFRESFGDLTEDPTLCVRTVCDGTVKWHLSVAGFVRETLLSCGVTADNIRWDRKCTAGDPVHFFSHRRDHGKTGAMAGMIGLRPDLQKIPM